MNEYLFLLPIIVALILGVISPGPSFFVVAQTAMSKTRKEAIFIALGLAIGAAILALSAALGLYVLIENAPLIYLAFKLLGGLYLCFLAYKMYKSLQIKETDTKVENKTKGIIKSFLKGLFVQLSNPKTIIILGGIFAAFLPQDPPLNTYIILALLTFIFDSSWYILVAFILSTKKAQNSFLKYKKHITIASSSFLVLMGLKLIFNL